MHYSFMEFSAMQENNLNSALINGPLILPPSWFFSHAMNSDARIAHQFADGGGESKRVYGALGYKLIGGLKLRDREATKPGSIEGISTLNTNITPAIQQKFRIAALDYWQHPMNLFSSSLKIDKIFT
ncbi:hypothetical protein FGO68_gene6123 [Halteria grandinella]|uniref:Uncharacterized protein n=1 Tax=Halteria grandinella TaxID=5974 RepID=A0A8J8NJN5_HALGN|nr:hypothetical protein FGO68_gene6123 [Halteria grandinella]